MAVEIANLLVLLLTATVPIIVGFFVITGRFGWRFATSAIGSRSEGTARDAPGPGGA
jgi:hypothetical protein